MISGQIASINQAFSQALTSNDIQEARRLLQSGAIHSVTHDDFIDAVELGDLEIINALLAFSEIQTRVAASDNGALGTAAAYGHLDVANRLLEFPAVKDVIAANNNKALRLAAGSGHLEVVNRLLEFPAVEEAIAANNNEVLRTAAMYGQLAVTNRLLEFSAVVDVIAANNNDALKGAARNGYLDVVNRLLEFSAVSDAITADNNAALRGAAAFGRLDIVNRLLEFPAVVTTVAANNNAVLGEAVASGRLDIVNRLLEFSAVVTSIAADNNMVLRHAIGEGRLAVINRLLEFLAVRDAIAANNNGALRQAAYNGNLNVVSRLLEFPAVEEAIAANNNVALRIAATCGHLDVVNRLLEFPAVVAVATANNNEALRNAVHYQHHEVVARLRQIPAVAAYEAAHAEPIAAEGDIAAIAQDNESAIRDLSSAELEELSALKRRYAALFQEQGLEGILSGLRKHLIAKYQENPAQYQGQVLPLEYDGKFDKEASKEYYKNPYHTAYRYLFCQPNPWMSPEAEWVNSNAEGLSAHISDGTKENIAYLWLAASDNEAPLPSGYTRDDIQNRFIDLLMDAGRGHNWDKKRKKTIFKGKELVESEEAFDDGEGDKPSCSLGVTRRTAAQFFLLLQPAVKPLNEDGIYLQFKESLITHNSQKNSLFDKMITLDISKLEGLKSALGNFVLNAVKMEGLSEVDQGLLQAFSIDASALKSFVETCHQDFGERFTAKANLKWHGEHFDSYEQLVQHFAHNVLTVFYKELAQKCEDLTPKKPVIPEAPAPVTLSMPAAAAPLLFSGDKKSRSKRRSEVQLLEPSSSSSTPSSRVVGSELRRSARLAAKKAQPHDSFAPKRRCHRR